MFNDCFLLSEYTIDPWVKSEPNYQRQTYLSSFVFVHLPVSVWDISAIDCICVMV